MRPFLLSSPQPVGPIKEPPGRQLILSALLIVLWIAPQGLELFGSLQFRLSQYVKDRFHINLWSVENNGFEPLTPCLQSRCSSQLS